MPDPPRLLHKHSEHGYTQHPHEALTDEPEAVDHDTQQRLTHEAQLRHTQRQRELWHDSRGRLLENLDLVQQHLGSDVAHELRAIRREIDRIERRLAS
jgi:hypothetical protein